MRGENAKALALYQQARGEFAGLKLQQDEMRTVRTIVDLQLKGTQAEQLPQLIARLIQLGDQVTRTERESAAADFEERLRYAESNAALASANVKTKNERLSGMVNESKYRYSLAAGILALCTLGVAVALYFQQRKYGAMMRVRGREMEVAISTDFLTAVHSRRYITDAGHAAVEQAIGKRLNLAVAIVDIGHFKKSTTASGMRPAMKCSKPSPPRCAPRVAIPTPWGATAAKNSRCCCRGSGKITRSSPPNASEKRLRTSPCDTAIRSSRPPHRSALPACPPQIWNSTSC